MSRFKPALISNNPFYNRIWGRVFNKDQNEILLIVGGTGTCKSGTALRIGQDLDIDCKGGSRFNLDHIFFTTEDFMKITKENYPSGSVFIWDEMQVKHNAREFYTIRNKVANIVLSTFRYKRYVLIMTMPHLKNIDVVARELGHDVIGMKGKVGDGNEALGDVRYMNTDALNLKGYIGLPRYKSFDEDSPPIEWTGFYFPRPSKELEDAYKDKKDVFLKSEWADDAKDLLYAENILKAKQSKSLTLPETLALFKDPDSLNRLVDPVRGKVVLGLLAEDLSVKGLSVSAKVLSDTCKALQAKFDRGDFSVGCSGSNSINVKGDKEVSFGAKLSAPKPIINESLVVSDSIRVAPVRVFKSGYSFKGVRKARRIAPPDSVPSYEVAQDL